MRIFSYSDGRPSIENSLASNKPFRPIHSNGPDPVLTQVLRHLQHQTNRIIQNLKSSQDWRQPLVKTDIDDGTNDLADLSDRTFTGELISDLTTGAGLSRRRRRFRCNWSSCRRGVLGNAGGEGLDAAGAAADVAYWATRVRK
ncbi:ATPB protein [Quillaja saponaria]|uniref:ATPB protein n=1 Tax=Quillaja saponaria TaxID=32244 RepID=A0AAD7M5F3_QUISA|nr:ATPB protein [Quillaja saponaria]